MTNFRFRASSWQGAQRTARAAHSASYIAMDAAKQEELRQAFAMFDTDGSGSVDAAEIGRVLGKLGHKPSKKELEEMIQELDADGDGEIDFGEFSAYCTKASQNGSGPLSEQLSRWLSRGGSKVDAAAIGRMRTEAALRDVAKRRAEGKEVVNAQKALEAVSKSQAALQAKFIQAENKQKSLQLDRDVVAARLEETREALENEKLSADERVALLQSQIVNYEAELVQMKERSTLLETQLEGQREQRREETATLEDAYEDMSSKADRKDTKIEALVSQVATRDAKIAQLQADLAGERDDHSQTQDSKRSQETELRRDKQVDVSRREDRITRLLVTLDKMRERESVLLDQLRAMTGRKDAYKLETKELKSMIQAKAQAGRKAKSQADSSTLFTIVR